MILFAIRFVWRRVLSWFQSDSDHKITRINTKRIAVLPILFSLTSLPLPAQKPAFAELVVVNAKVRTITSSDSVAEAFAVSGNRISSVGTNNLIRKLIGPSTRVIDAKGRLVLPGFNDAHVHFMAIGNSFSSIGRWM